jgi:cytochrome c556
MMTKEQARLVDKALGAMAYHALAAKKSKRPYDLAKVREHAARVEEVARVLKESLDSHMGAAAVLDKAG